MLYEVHPCQLANKADSALHPFGVDKWVVPSGECLLGTSSRVQLDMRNLSLWRCHPVNAYEIEAGIGVIAGNTVWSMPERLECEVLQ